VDRGGGGGDWKVQGFTGKVTKLLVEKILVTLYTTRSKSFKGDFVCSVHASITTVFQPGFRIRIRMVLDLGRLELPTKIQKVKKFQIS
jgi:hypothetical protein